MKLTPAVMLDCLRGRGTPQQRAVMASELIDPRSETCNWLTSMEAWAVKSLARVYRRNDWETATDRMADGHSVGTSITQQSHTCTLADGSVTARAVAREFLQLRAGAGRAEALARIRRDLANPRSGISQLLARVTLERVTTPATATTPPVNMNRRGSRLERSVLLLVQAGRTKKEMANELGVSVKTIDFVFSRLMRRFAQWPIDALSEGLRQNIADLT